MTKARAHTHAHTQANTNTNKHTHTHLHTHTHTHTHTHNTLTHTYTHTLTHSHIQAHKHASMHTHKKHSHVHTHAHWRACTYAPRSRTGAHPPRRRFNTRACHDVLPQLPTCQHVRASAQQRQHRLRPQAQLQGWTQAAKCTIKVLLSTGLRGEGRECECECLTAGLFWQR
jgi:hypothetical protein